MKNYVETLYDAYGQEFRVDQMLFENKTEHQHLVIFQNALFGRVMALDGIIQTTERDEFIYHEMLTHVPVFAHGRVKKVLIVGGGDGAMLREVCRHESIESIVQVEIDQQVIEMCKEFLPGHSQGAFEDSRVEIVIDDGLRYVENTSDSFDLIISDSTDPIGPGEVLFTENFYRGCQRCLRPGGVLVTQNGVAFLQMDEVKTTGKNLSSVFGEWCFYSAAIPTYVGGLMTFAWASNQTDLHKPSLELLEQRYSESGIRTRYYNPSIHLGAFALPQYIVEALEETCHE